MVRYIMDIATRQVEEPNVPLFRKVLEHIENQPEEWDQNEWVSACGTKACFAGWALHFTGHTLKQVMLEDGELWTELDGHGADQAPYDVIDAACAELGIHRAMGMRLFDSDNSMRRLRTLSESICGEPL